MISMCLLLYISYPILMSLKDLFGFNQKDIDVYESYVDLNLRRRYKV